MQDVTRNLASFMKRECELLARFHESETLMKIRVQEKDWGGLDSVIGEMTRHADELVEIENGRHEAFLSVKSHVGEGENASFYQVVAGLPADERKVLADLYRAMKLSAIGIRSASVNIGDEVRTMNSAVQDVIGELYPHQKGQLYSKSGYKRPNGTNPLLVDHEL